jgi:hypothetical protein
VRRIRLRFEDSPFAELPAVQRVRPPLPPFHVERGTPAPVLAAARAQWEARLAEEYVGVMVMRRFHGLLVDLHAPMDLQELSLRLALHKQVHTAWCASAVRALGGAAEVEFELEDLQQARGSAPLNHQLVELVAGVFAVGEVHHLALLRHCIQHTPPSAFRDVLKRIAAHELLHGHLGPPLIEALREAPWIEWPGEDLLHFYVLRQVQTLLEREVAPPSLLALAQDPAAESALATLGVPAPAALRISHQAALRSEVPLQMRRLGLEISLIAPEGGGARGRGA